MAFLDEASFKEAEHPRGQPGNAGQFASSAGGSKKQPSFRGSLARETSGNSEQPVKTLNELYDLAKKEEPEFKKTMSSIAGKYNAEVLYTPPEFAEPGTILKSRKSAERKLHSELGGDASKIRDVMRATIVSGQVEDTRKAAADFIKEHADSILRVKDRYVNPLNGGYRDILINYRTPEGLVAEVQFNSKTMVRAKNEQAHLIYEQVRGLKPPPDTATVLRLEKEMQEVYETAYKADGNSNWKRKKAMALDAQPDGTLRRYRVTPPTGEPFDAKITDVGGRALVLSNATGSWAVDNDFLTVADLLMPEQRLNDAGWDVTPVDPASGKEPEPDIGEEEEDSQVPVTKRALDRARDQVDFEYYTSEKLGPNQELTPEGFLICYDVPVARIGEMVYGPGEVPGDLGIGADGKIRVQREAASVFDPKSMASLNGKPVTDDHPPVDVDTFNWKEYTRGMVMSPRRGTGEFKDFLMCDLIIYDQDTIEDIQAGKREVSCGYNPDYLELLDEHGVRIVGRGEQINIRYNHLALVSAGRCGPFCSIRDHKTVDAAPANEDADDDFYSPARAARLERVLSRFA